MMYDLGFQSSHQDVKRKYVVVVEFFSLFWHICTNKTLPNSSLAAPVHSGLMDEQGTVTGSL